MVYGHWFHIWLHTFSSTGACIRVFCTISASFLLFLLLKRKFLSEHSGSNNKNYHATSLSFIFSQNVHSAKKWRRLHPRREKLYIFSPLSIFVYTNSRCALSREEALKQLTAGRSIVFSGRKRVSAFLFSSESDRVTGSLVSSAVIIFYF